MGSMTHRYSAVGSPETPSSPRTAARGKAVNRERSINFWQRTSSSSLMSWRVAEFTFFTERRLARINAPAARAALTAASWAFWRLRAFMARRWNVLFEPGGGFDLLAIQLPGVLVEVDVVLAPFQFAALEIHIVRAHRPFLRR